MSIKSYARFLQNFCLFVVIPLFVIAYFYKWLSPTIPVYSDIADGVKQVNLFAGVVRKYMVPNFSFHSPMLSRILGIIIDGISVFFLCGVLSRLFVYCTTIKRASYLVRARYLFPPTEPHFIRMGTL